MSKKTLNVHAIANELEGASLFFQKPKTTSSLLEPQQPRVDEGTRIAYEAKNERPNVPTNEPTNVQRPQREKVRHTFDIYRDQLLALQGLQLEAVRAGRKKPKLGDMVQRAIDMYLRRRRKKMEKYS